MKTKIFKIFVVCFALICLGGAFLLPQNTVFAEQAASDDDIFRPLTISNNGKFSLTVQANSRLVNVDLYKDVRKITNSLGNEINYYCFKWRDLDNLNFQINSNVNANMREQFNGIHLFVTYLKTDEKLNPVDIEKEFSLYNYTITSNTLKSFDFNYYIDSDSKATITDKSAKGFGFGLYKFELSYDYYDPSTMQDEHSTTICEATFNLAVVPDLIDEIPTPSDISITYTISSSNRLLNNYLFKLTSSAYQYVNPAYLQWEVTGMGKDKQKYCRDDAMKNADIMNYSDYDVIKPVYGNHEGNSFLLDTNNIEGTWTATCIIKNSKGETILKLDSEQVSTIKAGAKNLYWIIWLVFGILLLLAIIICTIIIVKNKTSDKVW